MPSDIFSQLTGQPDSHHSISFYFHQEAIQYADLNSNLRSGKSAKYSGYIEWQEPNFDETRFSSRSKVCSFNGDWNFGRAEYHRGRKCDVSVRILYFRCRRGSGIDPWNEYFGTDQNDQEDLHIYIGINKFF